MSTQFYTQDQPATRQQDTGRRAPRPHRDGSRWPADPRLAQPSGRWP